MYLYHFFLATVIVFVLVCDYAWSFGNQRSVLLFCLFAKPMGIILIVMLNYGEIG
ncbi:hypothetical protein V1524DRAFT_436218, partial [Lipomyces starkeyi]